MADPDRAELEALIDEVRLLWNALVRWGEEIHERESITMGMRAVLEFLRRNGPASVPNIARSRRVTRQQIQSLVNPLLELGLVEAADNAAHRRSPLIRLTAGGRRTIDRMRRREGALLEGAAPAPSTRDLERAARVLRAVRGSIEERS